MKKTELKELYQMMFPNYPDIVTVKQLQVMLGVSRHLAYKLINTGGQNRFITENSEGQCNQFRDRGAKGGEARCLKE